MSLFRLASPGAGAAKQVGDNPTQSDVVRRKSLSGGNVSIEDYLHGPSEKRLGVCCSGGGIRSASYSLGALQVLRNAGVLTHAEYLSAVSGGCYTAVAHATIVGTTGGDFSTPKSEHQKRIDQLSRAFRLLAPWAPSSPEEENLRTRPGYLASGAVGWIWLTANLLYGMLRHILPFLAGIAVAGGLTGFALHRWVDLKGQVVQTLPATVVALALLSVAAACLGLRQWVQSRELPSDSLLQTLQNWTLTFIAAAIGTSILLALVPELLVDLRGFGPDGSNRQALLASVEEVLRFTGIGTVGLGGVLAVLSLLAKRGLGGRITGALALIAGPLLLFSGYLGITYWVTLEGVHLPNLATIDLLELLIALTVLVAGSVVPILVRRLWCGRQPSILSLVLGPLLRFIAYAAVTYWAVETWFQASLSLGLYTLPALLLLLSIAVIIRFWLSDQVTANMHDFYRERLSTIFIGKRGVASKGQLEHLEPPWATSLYFSELRGQTRISEQTGTTGERGPKLAEFPKLIICAAVALSDAVPPGRNAASFTFEQDWSGGPATGYMRTSDLERRSGTGTLTLPALMAISGAAVAPSMGRKTRAGMRLLLAMFNIRLGVWLPNPRREGGAKAADIRTKDFPEPPTQEGPDKPRRRPGALYVLREALGLNSVKQRYVYVTDGGHWDNLGLVELLRRGCTQIVCFDASGGDAGEFHTLANAISLAKSDLDVEVLIDTSPLVPKDGFSSTDVVTGTIRYPTGTEGILVYAKSVLPADATPDLVSFHKVDPKFPNHTTADQFFDERKYESYRALGHNAALRSVRHLNVYRTTFDDSVFDSGHPPASP